MAAFKLADLVAKARLRADMVNSTFVSDPDVKELVNSAYAELYELLVTEYEDYFVKSYSFTTVSGTDTYDLSGQPIFKLRGIDAILSAASGDTLSLEGFEWVERERFSQPPDGAYNLKLWYVPNLVPLDDTVPGTSDVLPSEIRSGWEEFIVVDAAIQMLSKEQNDVGYLVQRKEQIRKRITESAANRNAERPHRMQRRPARNGIGSRTFHGERMRYHYQGSSLVLRLGTFPFHGSYDDYAEGD